MPTDTTVRAASLLDRVEIAHWATGSIDGRAALSQAQGVDVPLDRYTASDDRALRADATTTKPGARSACSTGRTS
jgi:hypothetical protein